MIVGAGGLIGTAGRGEAGESITLAAVVSVRTMPYRAHEGEAIQSRKVLVEEALERLLTPREELFDEPLVFQVYGHGALLPALPF